MLIGFSPRIFLGTGFRLKDIFNLKVHPREEMGPDPTRLEPAFDMQ